VRRILGFGHPGIFLSGGLDSVSIAAVATDLSQKEGWPLPLALSVAFPDPESNEEPIQRAVAAGLGMDQVVLPFTDAVGEEGLIWPNMALNRELPAPLSNPWSAAYRNLMLQSKARGANTILTGSGGDDWLTVNPDYMADLLAQGKLLNSYRFTRSALKSFRASRWAMIKSMVWYSGLRPIMTRQLRRIGRKLAPEKLNNVRFNKFLREKATPEWIAPDPALKMELTRRTTESILEEMSRAEPTGPYGFYRFSSISFTFSHPLNSLAQEENFEVGRQLDMRLLHPYWDNQLIQYLCKVPPRLLLRGGREKGLVRQSIATRFPELGFESQKKVQASSFFRSITHKEGPSAWQRLEGAKALQELGIVRSNMINDIMQQSFSSDSTFTSFRAWEVLNLESWVRHHR
jgi:asparagine synthetase B (glutamine-hydrolysing)